MPVLGQGTWLVAAGIVFGAAGAYWFTQMLSQFLFGAPPPAMVAYSLIGVAFLLAALLATLGPAVRATTINPLTTLKTD